MYCRVYPQHMIKKNGCGSINTLFARLSRSAWSATASSEGKLRSAEDIYSKSQCNHWNNQTKSVAWGHTLQFGPQYYFSFFFFSFAVLHGMQDLSSSTRDQTCALTTPYRKTCMKFLVKSVLSPICARSLGRVTFLIWTIPKTSKWICAIRRNEQMKSRFFFGYSVVYSTLLAWHSRPSKIRAQTTTFLIFFL